MSTGKQPFIPKRKAVRLDFKGTDLEGLEVSVTLSIPFGLVRAMKDGNDEAVIELMPRMIVDWNLADESGQILPVTAQGMDQAGMDVIMSIFAQAMKQLQVGGLSPNAGRPSGTS